MANALYASFPWALSWQTNICPARLLRAAPFFPGKPCLNVCRHTTQAADSELEVGWFGHRCSDLKDYIDGATQKWFLRR